ncbi:MAG: aspartyl protease family protein [Sphingomicrobium sp.]
MPFSARSALSQICTYLIVALVFVSQPCAAAEPPPQTFYSGPSKVTIPLRRVADGKLLLTTTVQGQPLTLMVDTGGSQFLDVGVAQRLGLKLTDAAELGYGLGGAAVVKLAVVDMKLGALSVTGLPVSCIDLAPLRNAIARQNAPLFDGIVGSELLTVLRARIDYEKLTLELRRPTAASIADQMRK